MGRPEDIKETGLRLVYKGRYRAQMNSSLPRRSVRGSGVVIASSCSLVNRGGVHEGRGVGKGRLGGGLCGDGEVHLVLGEEGVEEGGG